MISAVSVFFTETPSAHYSIFFIQKKSMDDGRWEGHLDEIMSKPRNGPNGIHREVSADLCACGCQCSSSCMSSFSCIKHITLLHIPLVWLLAWPKITVIQSSLETVSNLYCSRWAKFNQNGQLAKYLCCSSLLFDIFWCYCSEQQYNHWKG